ncbi:MAG: hypothetical protein KAI84_15320, partial [Gammaproteobacteria bacterium]|nr:hypothetical protein [Gammaproteobacteria bacterium]
IVEYIANYLGRPSPDHEDLPEISPYSYPVKGIGNIRVIPAGKKDRDYQSLITTMNWAELYQQKKGYRFIEQLKERIRIEFAPDYLLIDSRTGLADISGITTHQMADIVVLVFNLNRQNLDGIKKAYQSISESPKAVPVKTILVASPVPRDLLSETDLVGSRLREASESMPGAVNSGSEGKDEIALIPYHPLLSVDDFVFVKDYPGYDISKAYENVTSMILKYNPDEIRFLLDMAFKYYQDNLLDEAEEEFNSVINKYPENAKGYYYYGDFLAKTDKWSDAVEQFTRACRISQKNLTYMTALGAVLSRQDKNESALETFLAAENLSPKNESILQNIANLYYKLDNSEKHIEYIKKLTQARLPITKADRIDPLKEFEALFPAFIEAELHFPKKFNREYFWDALKGAIRFSFLEKANIITSILERKTTYFQTNQLLKTIKKEQEKSREIFGEKCNLIYEKIKRGDLKDISDEITLRKIIKKEASDNANVFRKLLAYALSQKNKVKDAADTYKDILKNEPDDHESFNNWG